MYVSPVPPRTEATISATANMALVRRDKSEILMSPVSDDGAEMDDQQLDHNHPGSVDLWHSLDPHGPTASKPMHQDQGSNGF